MSVPFVSSQQPRCARAVCFRSSTSLLSICDVGPANTDGACHCGRFVFDNCPNTHCATPAAARRTIVHTPADVFASSSQDFVCVSQFHFSSGREIQRKHIRSIPHSPSLAAPIAPLCIQFDKFGKWWVCYTKSSTPCSHIGSVRVPGTHSAFGIGAPPSPGIQPLGATAGSALQRPRAHRRRRSPII